MSLLKPVYMKYSSPYLQLLLASVHVLGLLAQVKTTAKKREEKNLYLQQTAQNLFSSSLQTFVWIGNIAVQIPNRNETFVSLTIASGLR